MAQGLTSFLYPYFSLHCSLALLSLQSAALPFLQPCCQPSHSFTLKDSYSLLLPLLYQHSYFSLLKFYFLQKVLPATCLRSWSPKADVKIETDAKWQSAVFKA